MAWTIKGESGKALDATVRSMESLRINNATLKFQSLAPDVLTWTAKTDNATGAGTIVPDYGQIVELFRDGVRKFRGHVTKPRVGMDSITVEVQGPWWWLTRTDLTSNQVDDTGASAERAKYVFATGALATMITNLIDRAIASPASVPMIRGTVAAMYDFTRVTLSNMSVADALAHLMQRVPDSVAWFDYSGTSGTFPTLNISRRNGASAMTAINLAIGTDLVEMGEISPRLDLEIVRTDLNYMIRNSVTGKPQFASQSDGTALGAATVGKRQIITVSGPEIVDFLPLDSFRSQVIQTYALTGSTAESYSYDPVIAKAVQLYGALSFVQDADYGYFQQSLGPPQTSGANIILQGKVPGWMADDYAIVESQFRVYGTFFIAGAPTSTINHLKTLGRAWTYYDPTYNRYQSLVMVDYTKTVINQVYGGWPAAAVTVYSKWDYDFINPPAGMAAGLRAAQAWVPWEGPVNLVADDVTGNNQLGNVVNLSGTLAACATMKATLKSQTHDIFRGRTTYEMGAPARLDFATAMGRVPSSPQDLIVPI